MSATTSSDYFKEIRSKIKLILGSGSFTRKLILEENGFEFEVVKADIDEKALGERGENANAYELVSLLAMKKAEAILEQKKVQVDTSIDNRRPILLTADQVVTCGDLILEKPGDEETARDYISMYNNGSCSTVGSIVLTDLSTGKRVIGVDSSTIHFHQIPCDVIEMILKEGVALNCAGGLMVEHPLLQPYIANIEGTRDSLMGLSVENLEHLLRQLKIE